MAKISGTVTSMNRAKTGLQLNSNKVWYNGTNNQLKDIAWKDEVTVDVTDDNKIVSITKVAGNAVAGNPNNSFAANEDKRQRIIVQQAARNAAITTVADMITAGALKAPVKDAEKYDWYLAMVEKITTRYYNDSMFVYENLALKEVDANE